MKPRLRIAGLVAASAWSLMLGAPLHAAGPTVRYVRPGGSGTGDGRSWANASGDLQAMIQSVAGPPAAKNAQIWVAAGTYLPNSCPNGGGGGREQHFSLRDEVAVYGGFPGTGTPVMEDRNPALYQVILSGDLGTAGNAGDNAYHVLHHPAAAALGGTAVLDGVTIRGGRADGGAGDQDAGGGMFNDASSPTLINCLFEQNFAAGQGGGLFNRSSSPALQGCRFTLNEASRGGGLYNESASAPCLTRCTFTDNTAAAYGGGVFTRDGAPCFFTCAFTGNGAVSLGGGLCSGPDAPVLMANCVLTGNISKGLGGGVFHNHSNASVVNCTFYNNEAANGGGAVFNSDGSAAGFRNSVFWLDASGSGAREIADDASSASKVENCIVRDGWSGEGSGNSEDDPRFRSAADPDGVDNAWFTDDDGLRVVNESPAIDAGSNDSLPADAGDLDNDADLTEPLPLDMRDRLRVDGTLVDMGAYERQHFTVTIDPGPHATWIGGGELVQQVAEGEAAVAPQLRMEAGWALTGWSPPLSGITGPTNPVAQTSFVMTTGGVCHVKVGGTGSGATWVQATGDMQGAIEAMATAGGGQVWVAAGTYAPNSWPNGGSAEREKHFSLRNTVAVLGGFPATGDPGLSERNPAVHLTVCTGLLAGGPDKAFHVFFHPAAAALNGTARLDGLVISDGYANGGMEFGNGAGMYNFVSSPTVIRCVFRGNNASEESGGMHLEYSASLVSHCAFAGNQAYSGGGLGLRSSQATIAGCLFVGNSSMFGGGIALSGDSSCLIRSSTMCGNNATYGGGIWDTQTAATLANSIVWGNTASFGSQIHLLTGSGVSLSYCTVQGGWAGTGNRSGDPLFHNSSDTDGADNRWFTGDDGLRISMTGDAFETGNSGLLPADAADLDGDGNTTEPLPIDFRSQPRVSGSQLDIGAYEASPVTVTFDLGTHATRTGGGALSQPVLEGGSATAPTLSLQPGWAFSGWDVALTNIWAPRTITAQYTAVFTAGSICHVKVGGTGSGATWALCGVRLHFKSKTAAEELANRELTHITTYERILNWLVVTYGEPEGYKMEGEVFIPGLLPEAEREKALTKDRYASWYWCRPKGEALVPRCTASMALVFDRSTGLGQVLFVTAPVWAYAYARQFGGAEGDPLYRVLNGGMTQPTVQHQCMDSFLCRPSRPKAMPEETLSRFRLPTKAMDVKN